MVDEAAGFAYVDDGIVPLSQARVPLLDRGYLLGDGVFETLRTHEGRLFRMDAHLRRFRKGLETVGVDPGAADQAIGCALELVAYAAPRLGPELYVRAQVTTATVTELEGAWDRTSPTAFVRPFRPWPSALYERGVRLVLADQRKDTRHPLAGVKATSFLAHVLARREAKARGADDALLLNSDGRVCEASTSNVFALLGQVLHAPGPEEGALEGVTRGVVLESARELGLAVEDELTLDELREADEAFLTNTVAGVAPVQAVADVASRLRGPDGPVTKQLAAAYARRLEGA